MILRLRLKSADPLQNHKQTISFDHLWEWTNKLAKFTSSNRRMGEDMSKFVAPLLNLRAEGELQREIKDVIDELDIMIYIYSQQKDVLKKFVKEVGKLLKPDKMEKKKSSTVPVTSPTPPTSAAPSTSRRDQYAERLKAYDQRLYNYDWFNRTARELLEAVDDRTAELRGLKLSAESTSQSVGFLSTGRWAPEHGETAASRSQCTEVLIMP